MKKANRPWKILCAVLAVLVLAEGALLLSCASELRSLRHQLETKVSVGNQTLADPDAIAAEFKGGVVTAAEAAAEYAQLIPYYEMLGMNEADYEQESKQEILERLAEEKILVNKARELGVYEMDAEESAALEARVQADYEEMVEYYMAFRMDGSRPEEEVRTEVVAYLAENGSTYEGMLEEARQEVWRDRLFDAVTADLSISDEELRAFYDEQLGVEERLYTASFAEYESDCASGKQVLWNPEGVRRVQMLVIPFDEEQVERYANVQAFLAAGNADRLAELDVLYGELEAAGSEALARVEAGEDFIALMQEYGGTNPAGECMSEKSSLYGDDVREAAMALDRIGDTSGLVRCDGGLCILRYASDVAPGAVPYDEVADSLRSGYAEELRLKKYNSTVMQWLAESDIRCYPERF